VLTQHYARLFALTVIDESDYRKKSQSAALLVNIFQAATTMQQWAARQFHSASLVVSWNDKFNPVYLNILRNGDLDRDALESLLGEVWASMCAAQADMTNVCLASREFLHWAPLVNTLIAGGPPIQMPLSATRFSSNDFLRVDRSLRVPTRKIIGPRTSHLDPIFSAEYSLQEFVAPTRADRIESMVPYFWTLSSREAMVCDSCLLSAIEYDGLPLQFYRDMARQAADEARHAVMYLDLAVELMPSFLDRARHDDQSATLIRKFLNGAGKLPVPKEGNLFFSMWHASLQERLVIMQITTEGAAVASTRKAIDSALAQEFPSVKRAFEVDYYDEVAHTRIGTRWLKYLCPNSAQRKNVVENAKLLRGILILTCFVTHDDSGNIASLMGRYGANQVMGARDFFSSARY
jgi:hypothetical protein